MLNQYINSGQDRIVVEAKAKALGNWDGLVLKQ